MKKNPGQLFLMMLLSLLQLMVVCNMQAQYVLHEQQDRWAIQPDSSIKWTISDGLPHADHIEMSGEKVSVWIRYEVTAEARPAIIRTVVFPTFRTKPNDTNGSLMYNFYDADLPRFFINNKPLRADIINGNHDDNFPEKVTAISQKGIMKINSDLGSPVVVKLERSLFPSVDKPMAIERFVFTNSSNRATTISMEYMQKQIRTDSANSTPTPHTIIMGTVDAGRVVLQPGASTSFSVYYLATNEPQLVPEINVDGEEAARKNRVNGIEDLLQLETPDTVLNTAFAFAKIRATESIYKTKAGYMHGPGGLTYYAAIWANDQAEYVNPFFAFLGDSIGNKSAMNAYRMFARFMNPDYKQIPSSIIAEGDDIWNGAGDRGDMAMIAYGASRYCLAYGNIDSAKVLWPLVEWCLEYCKRKVNPQGVVASDADELEGRFPAGKANLNTSSLYYDALNSAALLGKLLGKPTEQLKQYRQQATALKSSIEKYFGATVEGFKTYRYYEGNTQLRAWITTPLVMDIFDRKDGTIAALFSPQLWTEDGLASLAGNKTFWDRSTLYALRGVLAAGETEKALAFLKYYSRRRLLGEHVPYPVEAYPEGGQRHLSAESGLYCRIYTEGMFGMRPTGFNSFNCTPRLPAAWNKMALRNIHSFGHVFDLEIIRANAGKLMITITNGSSKKTYNIKDGATQKIELQ